MIRFQIVLFILLFLIDVFVYYRFGRSKGLIIKLTIVTAITSFFILYPDKTTLIANFFGIHRGTDLLLYCSILFFIFLHLKMYVKMKKLEAKLTVMVRENSITNLKRTINSISNEEIKNSEIDKNFL